MIKQRKKSDCMKNYNYDETLGRLNLEKMSNPQSTRKLEPNEIEAIFWGYEDLLHELDDKDKLQKLADDKANIITDIQSLATKKTGMPVPILSDNLHQLYAIANQLNDYAGLAIADYHHWADDDLYPAQLYVFDILNKVKKKLF